MTGKLDNKQILPMSIKSVTWVECSFKRPFDFMGKKGSSGTEISFLNNKRLGVNALNSIKGYLGFVEVFPESAYYNVLDVDIVKYNLVQSKNNRKYKNYNRCPSRINGKECSNPEFYHFKFFLIF